MWESHHHMDYYGRFDETVLDMEKQNYRADFRVIVTIHHGLSCVFTIEIPSVK